MNPWSEFTLELAPTEHSNIDRELGGRETLMHFRQAAGLPGSRKKFAETQFATTKGRTVSWLRKNTVKITG
jgi:hypothetical protein